MKSILILVSFCSLFFFACSKKNEVIGPHFSVAEFDELTHDCSPFHGKGSDALDLSIYAPGVIPAGARSLLYQRLSFFAIPFENEQQAIAEALRLNQYYARNWLFDRVEGEPILEDYVILKFKAINPNRKFQRIPKGHAPAHGKVHH